MRALRTPSGQKYSQVVRGRPPCAPHHLENPGSQRRKTRPPPMCALKKPSGQFTHILGLAARRCEHSRHLAFNPENPGSQRRKTRPPPMRALRKPSGQFAHRLCGAAHHLVRTAILKTPVPNGGKQGPTDTRTEKVGGPIYSQVVRGRLPPPKHVSTAALCAPPSRKPRFPTAEDEAPTDARTIDFVRFQMNKAG
jgi:hypothetical protein